MDRVDVNVTVYLLLYEENEQISNLVFAIRIMCIDFVMFVYVCC